MKYKLSPSILAADFNILGEQIAAVAKSGAQYLHIDVMDGLFVPSISFGMPLIKSIRKNSDLFFDVHLMIQDPERYIDEFIACGADNITIHAEATKEVRQTLLKIKAAGLSAGIAISPGTPAESIADYLEIVDMVLVMTVNPGFGGQSYIPESTDKIRHMRELLNAKGLDTDIEIDGGITRENINMVLEAGANVIVMGSSVFKGNIEENVSYFKGVFDEKE